MAYRMKMFKSQKPSSFDLRVSDFKRIPGFNDVLPVLTEDEHTYNSLAQGKRENIWRSMPNLARARARQRAKRKFQRRAVLGPFNTVLRGVSAWTRDGSLIAAHNMSWVLSLLWARPYNTHNTHHILWAAMPREP